MTRRTLRGIGVVLVAVMPLVVPAQDAEPESQTDREKLEELDQKVRVLERKAELEAETVAEQAKKQAQVSIGKDGFAFRSADGAYALRVRGYVQVDGVAFVDDTQIPGVDTMLIRRARPILEGTVGRIVDFRLMPDFGNGRTVLYDAWVEFKFHPLAKLRAGKYKPPVGLERLQSATDILFIIRAAPTLLVPTRDVGVQLHGDWREGLLNYAVMVENGVPDGASADVDTNDGKEIAARLFAHPFKSAGRAMFRGIGVGLAGSAGQNAGTVASPALPSYRSPGDRTVFAFLSDGTAEGTAFADGSRERLSPQAYWYAGRVGVLTEYVRSSQEVRLDTSRANLENSAWQVAVGVLLTDDVSSFRGVSPRKPFVAKGPGAGAFELAARWSELDVDDDTFPVFADPARSVTGLSEWAVGVNWYLSRNARIALNYDCTRFDGGAADGADRETENVILSRFQVSF